MFKLEPLKYEYSALEPHYDAKTVEIHHSKHQQSYVDNLNKALEKFPKYKDWTLQKILSNLDEFDVSIRTTVANNAGGIYNHEHFWNQFSPNPSKISGKIKELIEAQYGSFEKFKEEFSNKAKTNFGSGWTWLSIDTKNNKLQISNVTGHYCPISFNQKPLLTIDTWEHAYYLKWQNRRPEWIEAFWNLVNWDFINSLL